MIFLVQEQPSHRSWLSLVLIFLLWSYKLHNLTQFLWPGHLIMSNITHRGSDDILIGHWRPLRMSCDHATMSEKQRDSSFYRVAD